MYNVVDSFYAGRVDKYEGGTGNPVHDAFTKGIIYGGDRNVASAAPATKTNSFGINSDDKEYASKTRAGFRLLTTTWTYHILCGVLSTESFIISGLLLT